VTKISILGPAAVHCRRLPDDIEHKAYLDQTLLFHTIAQSYKRALPLSAAGRHLLRLAERSQSA